MASPPARLVLVAPFGTGWTLDAQRLLAEGWGEAQREMTAGLEAVAARIGAPRGWRSSAGDAARYHDFAQKLADELRAEVPQTFVECCGEDLMRHVTERHPAIAGLRHDRDPVDGPATFTLRDVVVGIADFGVGVVTFDYRVELAPDASLDAYRTQAEEILERGPAILDPLVPELRAPLDEYLTSEAGTRLCRLVAPHEADAVERRAETMMWVHGIHVVETADAASCDAEEAAWEGVLPPTHDEQCERAVADGVVFRPGLGRSLIVHAPGRERRAEILEQTLAQQTMYYVGASSFDRVLFRRLNELTLDTRAGRAQELMRGSGEIRELYERAELFRSIVANRDLHLAASTAWEVRAWSCLARTWRLDRRLVSIDRKLDALQRLYARVTGELGAERSHALTVVAFVFTAIAAITTILEAIDYTQREQFADPDPARTVTVILLVAAVALVVVAAMMWANRPMRGREP